LQGMPTLCSLGQIDLTNELLKQTEKGKWQTVKKNRISGFSFFKLSTLLNDGRINSDRLQKRYSSLGKGGESRSNEMPLLSLSC
jgi:hypothetical protein